jgi:hypothetical protein
VNLGQSQGSHASAPVLDTSL